MNVNFLRSERGTSVVEFAIAMPVLVLLVIGLIDMGRYTYYSILAAHAARAGAQYGDQNLVSANDKSGMQSAAKADGQNLTQWNVSATPLCAQNGSVLSCTNATPGPGNIYYVKVVVSGTFNTLINYPGVPSSLPLGATYIARVLSQ